MRGQEGLVALEIKFKSTVIETNIELYFDADDFFIREIPNEVNKFIRDNFILRNNSIEFRGNWTNVPDVRHKIGLFSKTTLW